MRSLCLARIIPSIFDAALAPELWPAALESIAETLGAVGAAYIIRDKRTGRVDWISLSGPSVELKAEYLTHYAALDPYSPVLDAAPSGTLVRLSDLPETVLRKNGWYNDFFLKSGVGYFLASARQPGRGQNGASEGGAAGAVGARRRRGGLLPRQLR